MGAAELYKFVTALPFSPRSSLMLYLMDGKIMHGRGLIKEYSLTTVQIKPFAWRNFLWYYPKHHHMFHASFKGVQLLVTQEIC